jgi:hypothetical protein
MEGREGLGGKGGTGEGMYNLAISYLEICDFKFNSIGSFLFFFGALHIFLFLIDIFKKLQNIFFFFPKTFSWLVTFQFRDPL